MPSVWLLILAYVSHSHSTAYHHHIIWSSNQIICTLKKTKFSNKIKCPSLQCKRLLGHDIWISLCPNDWALPLLRISYASNAYACQQYYLRLPAAELVMQMLPDMYAVKGQIDQASTQDVYRERVMWGLESPSHDTTAADQAWNWPTWKAGVNWDWLTWEANIDWDWLERLWVLAPHTRSIHTYSYLNIHTSLLACSVSPMAAHHHSFRHLSLPVTPHTLYLTPLSVAHRIRALFH